MSTILTFLIDFAAFDQDADLYLIYLFNSIQGLNLLMLFTITSEAALGHEALEKDYRF